MKLFLPHVIGKSLKQLSKTEFLVSWTYLENEAN